MLPIVRSQRLRSKTGCATCRIRRVKCDEMKPFCRRCQSTGRRCDGYSGDSNIKIIQYTPQITSPIQSRIPRSMSELLTDQEHRAWEFFHHQTAACFGRKAGEFLLRAAHTDPIIQAAALALSSLHRVSVNEDSNDRQQLSTGRQMALQQYSRAVRQGLNRLSDGSPDCINGTLIICALFFCFECLQGHYKTAFRHVASGLKIAQYQTQGPPAILQSILALMENQMLEVGGEICLPSNNTSPPVLISPIPPTSILGNITTLDELCDAFRIVYNQFLRLLYGTETLSSANREQVAQPRYAQAQSSVHQFVKAFDQFLTTHPIDDMTRASQTDIRTLQMWQVTLRMVLQVGWPPAESAWDKHIRDFAAIIILAEEVILNLTTTQTPSSTPRPPEPPDIKHNALSPTESSNRGTHISIHPKLRPSRSPASFSLSIGVLPVLWIVANSCRDSRIRYRAIDLMRRSRRQEGIWDSRLYARLAARVSCLEEQAAGVSHGVDYGPGDIPVQARVTDIIGRFEEGREGNVRYVWNESRFLEESVTW